MLGAKGESKKERWRVPSAGRVGRVAAFLFAVGVVTYQTGCSQVPAWLDPTKSESEGPQVLETAAGESEEEFPNLATVPDQPPDISKPRERQALLEKLQADLAAGEDDVSQTEASQVGTSQVPDAPPLAVVYFDRGVTSLGAANRNILMELVERHWKRGGHLRVVGLASPIASATDDQAQIGNFQIAIARAHNVAAALVDMGVPYVQVKVAARILAGKEDEDQRQVPAALQRRAEIYLEF
jgi:outer membrane protein OmpA-like peptidoglycan-associated protein